jgi:hypothetical protein
MRLSWHKVELIPLQESDKNKPQLFQCESNVVSNSLNWEILGYLLLPNAISRASREGHECLSIYCHTFVVAKPSFGDEVVRIGPDSWITLHFGYPGTHDGLFISLKLATGKENLHP